jgi:protein-disulfide isomerase
LGRVVATVAGQSVFEDDLLPAVQGQLHQLRLQEFELKSKALDNLINQRLLEAEAKRRGIAPNKLLEQEADAKVSAPTDSELQALYIVQKEQLARSFEELKPQLSQLLRQARVQQSRQDYYKLLRDQAGVAVHLRKPRMAVAADPSRLRGDPKAAVLIVEFSDYQCPHCRSVQPTLKAVLAKYEGKVSLAFRDFPLRDIHPQADLAAEASRCAGELGKFWEFHDALFQGSSAINHDSMTKLAASLSLDQAKFRACVDSGKYKSQIEQDRQLGLRSGITGTPGFLVNGTVLSGNLPQSSFEKIIETELRNPVPSGPEAP